ncbi:Xylan 1,4-beta-xylosidase (fragment) [Alteromonas sp. 38]|uniref:glycoside hydrolase family 3 N-terminal domain-containing protein n=1 Tax=unclassified Alteromonas TaxID=2614992 RepID=UPI0012F0801C
MNRIIKKLPERILIFACFLITSLSYAETLPFQNQSLPVETRVADLVDRLTLEEKVSQLFDKSAAIERLSIPEYYWWNEALHGVARAGKATVFPQAIGMAATFDEPLIYRIASTISDEGRAKHHAFSREDTNAMYTGLTYWSPNINLFRDPRWGRGQETYGEDPYLTSRMAINFVKGLEGDDSNYLKSVATLKHYAVLLLTSMMKIPIM